MSLRGGVFGSRVLELVGVAASGKSTLLRALAARSPQPVVGVAFPRALHLRYGAPPGARLLAAHLARGARGRFLSWDELRGMSYVDGWWARIERGVPGLTVLDHGPLFRLAQLHAFGPPLVESAAFRRWHERAIARWARRLDAVVWLDAPDETLCARIESRSQPHGMQGATREEQERFLARYRKSYEVILSELARAGGPPRLCFDTSRAAPDEIAERLLAVLEASAA